METILIQNFKAIKNTAKREIKVANLTILMGEQATGKSTVAKLVYFFKKLPEEIMFFLLKNLEISEQNFEKELSNSMNQFFNNLFDIANLDNNFFVIYKYENGFKVKIDYNVDLKKLIIHWPSESVINNLKIKWIPFQNSSLLINDNFDPKMYAEKEQLTIHLINSISSLFGNSKRTLFVPASRNVIVSLEEYIMNIFADLENYILTNNYTKISENNIIIRNFIKHIQKIKNRFKRGGFEQIAQYQKIDEETTYLLYEFMNQVEKIMVGKYRYVDSGERLYFDNLNEYVLLENASSGQQEAIRIIQDIFLEILEGKPIFRVYEEPESHLSPVGQLGIIQLIAMLANRNPDNQIIIPTHTPYLLREVSNMMKASKIVKDNPDLKEEVSKILEPFYWLDMQSVSAYQLTREGEIEDAIDEEYQMIDGELFDRVTNDISDQLDKLLSLQYE